MDKRALPSLFKLVLESLRKDAFSDDWMMEITRGLMRASEAVNATEPWSSSIKNFIINKERNVRSD